jgi:hypothetical protein
MDERPLGVEVRALVIKWGERLRIHERVAVEIVTDADVDGSCRPYERRETEGLWDFVLEIAAQIDAEDVERTVVHELVHLIFEPLRETYFYGSEMAHASAWNISWPKDIRPGHLTTWETVISRITDGYLRAYGAEAVEVFHVRTGDGGVRV